MRGCQLCGAKSWGPVPSDQELSFSRQLNLIDPESVHYWRCDGCGSLAQKMFIDEADSPAQFAAQTPESSTGTALTDILRPLLPRPETRLERLVRAMLQGEVSALIPMAQAGGGSLVGYARALESEIDDVPMVHIHAKEFSSERVCLPRVDFERYLLQTLWSLDARGDAWAVYMRDICQAMERLVNE